MSLFKSLLNCLFGSAEKLEVTVTEVAGAQAENAVASAISLACKLDKRTFRILQNVYVPIGNLFTEIDILLIHESGLYVFESKNVYGKLYGDLESPLWSCYTKCNQKQSFCNPINQNKHHIRCLREFLGRQFESFKAFNIIALGKNMTVGRVPPNTDEYVIYDIHALRQKFHIFVGKQQSCFSETEIKSLYSLLKQQTQVSAATKQEHINRLQKKKT